MTKRFIWTCIALIIVLIGLNHYGKTEREAQTRTVDSYGRALIGGPFTLVSHENAVVRDSDFRGELMLVFFGFSNCPAICPSALSAMSSTLEGLGDKADKVNALFITIDPERDDLEQISSYMENFHPKIIGLTGSQEQIDQATKAYRVYAKKVENEMMSGYMMDHSSFIYLMDKEGKYIKHLQYNATADQIIAAVNKYL